jgi:predicted permease
MEHWFYAVPLRLRSLFRRRRVERELDEELQYHLERKTEEYLTQGLTPRQSRQAALRAMDGLTQRKEECRDARGLNAIDDTVRDIRYGLRVLAKSPGFTAVAVLTLALGIGANAVVFGVLNGLILRPGNGPQAQRLYAIERASDNSTWQSYPDYLDLRDRSGSFDGLAGFSPTALGLDTGGGASQVWGYEVTGNYFDVLGVEPYLGRFFHGSDEHGPNSAPYIVLPYAYWHSHFQDDRGVVGRVVQLNKHPYTILGVAPPGFEGALLFFSPDYFVPMVNHDQVTSANVMSERGIHGILMVVGRLKAGVTPAQAIADLNRVGAYLEKSYPKDDGNMTFALARPGLLGDVLGRPVRGFVTGLMLLAGLILLAACANLGGLFAARAADRGREVALRLALGSGRTRILRQVLTEAVLISLAGGAAGLLGSVVLLGELSAWRPVPQFPSIHIPVTPDASVYLVALLLSLASGFLFGAVPVRQVLRTNPYEVIKSGSTGRIGRRISVRDLLLVVQIAICALLVTSSLVAVRGLVRSMRGNFGFDPRNAMLVNTVLSMAGYSGDRVPAMERRMIDALETIPGVGSVGLVSYPPLSSAVETWNVFADKTTDLSPSNIASATFMYGVSPEYFHAARTSLLSGRAFSWHDDKNAPRVAVVNREFARRLFGAGTSGVGGYYKLWNGTRIQVVGIVEDGKYLSLTEGPRAAMFVPFLQSPPSMVSLVVRSDRDPRQLATAMRNKLRELDAGLPFDIQTWTQELDGALLASRVATVSLGVLGAIGAMLAVTGIFGMAAYSVSRRLKELGIRIALGAQRKEVLQAALGRALKLLAFGSGAGLVLGILASRVLAFIVYQATPRDPLLLAGVVLVMLLLGLLATWIPAQRALSIDPVTLLREE